jgi:hypothetical protein
MAPVAVMAQTPEPADFPMRVAYCLGVTQYVVKYSFSEPTPPCPQNASREVLQLCRDGAQLRKNEQAFLDTRVARLRAYVIAKIGDPQWSLGIPLALSRGTADMALLIKSASGCTGTQDIIEACTNEALRQAGADAVASVERLGRCEHISAMLPF